MPTLHELITKRARVAEALRMINQAQQDIERAGSEGSYYAGLAAVWAGVLLTADIVKDGVSAADPRAALAFSEIDKAVDKANKLLVAFHRAPIARKSDALASLDPELRKVSTWANQVSKVSAWLLKLGSPVSKQTRGQIGVVISLANTMTQDTLLMLQAANNQNRLSAMSRSAFQNATAQMKKVQMTLFKLDAEIQKWLDKYDLYSGIA